MIAIIAALAGLLLPTLTKAKAKAQGVGCANNVKQLSLASALYVDDNSDRLVNNHGTQEILSRTSPIRASENCNVLQIKAGVSKVCTTPDHFLATCSAVICGGGWFGNFNFNCSSNTRCSGSGCV